MRHVAAACVASVLTVASAANAQDCINADPKMELSGISATDFELTADPQVAGGHLIYASPVADGVSSIVVARVNGRTGKVLLGSLSAVAGNYHGESFINGAEFVQKPTGELGLLYAGDGGVHGIFRSATPADWNKFKFDVNGAKLVGDPSPLPTTSDGAYPKGGIPFGVSTYPYKLGDCASACYAALDTGVGTDIVAVAAANGYTVYDSTQSPRDGYVFSRACKDGTGTCGLYEVLIDKAGGFATGTFQKVGDTAMVPSGSNRLISARHPVTGSTVLFAADKGSGGSVVNIWEQPAAGGKLTLIESVTVTRSSHFRAVTSNDAVVLHYRIRDNLDRGSYTIPVGANGTKLRVGHNTRISYADGGTELAWLPAANRWALYYRKPPGPLTLCWVNP